MTYASRTKVSTDQSRAEIERVLNRYGATRLAVFTEHERAILIFESHNRRIRFDLPLPPGTADKDNQIRRQRWRALLLCIKAKLESVETKIETFEEAFLAHVVMPDGLTVIEHTRGHIASIYSSGEMTPLLPAPKSSSGSKASEVMG